MDGYVVQQVEQDKNVALLSDTNTQPVIYEQLPENMRFDGDITYFNKDGKVKSYKVTGLDGLYANRSIEELANDIPIQNMTHMARNMFQNIDSYHGLLEKLNHLETEQGAEEALKEMKSLKPEYHHKFYQDKVNSVLGNLQDAISKEDKSVKEKPYSFYLVDDDELNAFASAGRVMVVTKGCFKGLGYDEDELAAILAHEFGHVQAEHLYRHDKERKLMAVGMNMLGPLLNQSDSAELISYTVADKMMSGGVTRRYEREADELGFYYLANSKYNPGAMAAQFERYQVLFGNDKNYINDKAHPSFIIRRDIAAKKLSDYGRGYVSVDGNTVKVNGRDFVSLDKLTDASEKTGAERAYLVMGNLARAYHNGLETEMAYAKGNTLMLGSQEIMVCNEQDMPADKLAESLNSINRSIRQQERVTGKKESVLEKPAWYSQNKFSYQQIFEEKNEMDKVKTHKTLVGFSDSLSQLLDNVSKIDVEGSTVESGKKVGTEIANFLANDNTVELAQLFNQQIKDESLNVVGKIKKNTMSIKSLMGSLDSQQELMTKVNHRVNLFESLGISSSDEKIESLRNQIIERKHENVQEGILSDNQINGMRINGSEAKQAMMGEILKNKKAVENLKKMQRIGKNTMQFLEDTRMNVFMEHMYPSLLETTGEYFKKVDAMKKANSRGMYNLADEINSEISELTPSMSKAVETTRLFLDERVRTGNEIPEEVQKTFDSINKRYNESYGFIQKYSSMPHEKVEEKNISEEKLFEVYNEQKEDSSLKNDFTSLQLQATQWNPMSNEKIEAKTMELSAHAQDITKQLTRSKTHSRTVKQQERQMSHQRSMP